MSSIAAMAARLIARRILSGATIAGDRVYDSAVDVMGLLTDDGQPTSVIVLSSDDETAKIEGRAVTGGERTATLSIEIASGQVQTVELTSGETVQQFTIPTTDAAAELLLTVIVRQTMRALFGGVGETADLFRRFVTRVEGVTMKRGVPSEGGTKFAARLIEIEFTPLSDPDFGADLPPVWDDFLGFIEAQDGAEVRALIEAAIRGAAVPDGVLAQLQLGLTEAEAAGAMIGGLDLGGD